MKTLKRCGTYFAVCLAVAMLFTTMPAAAFAQGADRDELPAAAPAAENSADPHTDTTEITNEVNQEHGDTGHNPEPVTEPEPEQPIEADAEPGSQEAGEGSDPSADTTADASGPAQTGAPAQGGTETGEANSVPGPPADTGTIPANGEDALAPEETPELEKASAPISLDDLRAMLAASTADSLLDVAETWNSDHLQALIDEADGTLVLEGDFVLDKTVTISKPLVIGGANGAPVSITLASTFHGRHFAINTDAGLVQLQFMAINGHGAPNVGGGISHSGSGGLKVQSVSFTNNSMGTNGGGIESTGAATITLTSCTFQNNVGVNGGGVYVEGDLVVEQGCLFQSNEATNNGGGAWAGGLIYDNSEFTGNYAGGNGGGLYIFDATSSYSADVSRLYGGSITSNTAGGNGGGIAFDTVGRQRLSYIELSGNQATNGGGLWLSDDYGGAVYVSAGAVLDNNAATNRGGGAYGGNWFYAEKGAVIQNNAAAYGGGAISSWGMNVADSFFYNNTATKAGGGIYMMSADGMLSLQNSEVMYNSTDGLTGGGIYLTYYTNIYTLECEFANNHSARGVYWDLDNPAPGEQEVAAELYPNDILWTTCSVPFTNIFNDWDVSFFFDEATVYAVTFQPNGGEWQAVEGTGSSTDAIVRHVGMGETAIVPGLITKGTDTLVGWYTDPALTNQWNLDSDTVQGDMTLYAKWSSHVSNTYTVTFYQDNTATSVVQTLTNQPENQTIAEPSPAPTNAGYLLMGWFTEPEYLNQWTFATDLLTGDLDLYARWRLDDWIDVVFMNQGSVYQRYHDEPAGQPFAEPDKDPERDGYIFTGWYKEDGTLWDFSIETSADDVTLYAGWRDDQLADVLYMDGGTEYRRVENYPEGALLSAPTPPEHTGKYFLGWFSEETGGTQWDFGADRLRKDMTLYAQYRDLYQYTITYVDGSTVLDTLPDVWEQSLLTQPAEPTPPDDDTLFGGWYLANGNKWDFDTYRVLGDTTLYTRWREDGLVDVDYYVEGGLYAHEDDLDPGSLLSEPATDPAIEGKVFTGWYYIYENGQRELWDFGARRAYDDMVLTAGFRDLYYYTATYWVGQDFATLYDNYTILEGSYLHIPREPRDAGYTFGGWYTDKELTNSWDFLNDTIEENMNLYARWRGDGLVDITFMDNGAVWRQLEDYDADKLLPVPDQPAKEGYKFLGWFTEETGGSKWDFASGYAEGDMTLYAQWEALKTAEITYEVDGKEYWTEEAYVGDKLTPPGRAPEKDGYTFDGWYKDEAGTIPWNFAKDLVEGDTTLYAKWSQNPAPILPDEGYDVVYIVDGVEYHRETGLASGVFLTAPTVPIKDGHTFGGWYRGTEADIPTTAITPVAGTAVPRLPALAAAPQQTAQNTLHLLAATPQAVVPVFWIFETDAMPGEMLVLVAYFDEDLLEDTTTSGAGSATSTGDYGNSGTSGSGTGSSSTRGSGASSSSSSSSAGATGADSSGRGSTRGVIARTGDTARTSLWVVSAALVLGIGCLLVALRKRKKQ